VFVKFLFIASSLLTIVSALSMLMTKDIMHACIFLLGALMGVAGLFLTLGADFLAATQVMVYIGGVVVLMLFAVMLTGGNELNKRGLNPVPLMGNKFTFALGVFGASMFFIVVYQLLYKIFHYFHLSVVDSYESTVEKIGRLLLTDHILAFEISSVLLLGALVGAAIIARPKRN